MWIAMRPSRGGSYRCNCGDDTTPRACGLHVREGGDAGAALQLRRNCNDRSGSNCDQDRSTPMSASTSSGLSLHLALVRVVPIADSCTAACYHSNHHIRAQQE